MAFYQDPVKVAVVELSDTQLEFAVKQGKAFRKFWDLQAKNLATAIKKAVENRVALARDDLEEFKTFVYAFKSSNTYPFKKYIPRDTIFSTEVAFLSVFEMLEKLPFGDWVWTVKYPIVTFNDSEPRPAVNSNKNNFKVYEFPVKFKDDFTKKGVVIENIGFVSLDQASMKAIKTNKMTLQIKYINDEVVETAVCINKDFANLSWIASQAYFKYLTIPSYARKCPSDFVKKHCEDSIAKMHKKGKMDFVTAYMEEFCGLAKQRQSSFKKVEPRKTLPWDDDVDPVQDKIAELKRIQKQTEEALAYLESLTNK